MSVPITFGFGMITGQRDPRDARDHTELYADLLELCVHAEELGFDAAWLSEHHFVDDGYLPSLLPMAAAIAARTTRLQIGTGILIAPLYDPVRLAEDAATVDRLSAGRLVMGIGAGYRDEEFAGLGKEKAGLGTRLDHTIDILRDAWGDGAVIREDGTQVSVTPKPHRAGGPPLWLGARTRPGIRRAARRAQGLLAARVTAHEFGEQVALFAAEVTAAGRPLSDVTVGVHCPVFAWASADAWELLEPHAHYSEWKYKDMTGEPYGRRTAPAQQPALRGETRDALRRGAIVGPPADVAKEIGRFAEAAGDIAFHFIPRLYWPGMDPRLQREAMTVFASDVIPLLR